MKRFLSTKTVTVIGMLLILSLNCQVAIGAGYVALIISNSSKAPSPGEVFESTISYSANNVVLGAYLLTMNYDSAKLKINTITVPDESEFNGQTFFSIDSFESGLTKISGFQTETSSEQAYEPILFTIQWETLSSCTPSETIELVAESLIDVSWRPVDTVYNPSRLLYVSNIDEQEREFHVLNKLHRLRSVNKLDIEFTKDIIITKDALIIEGQRVGYVDLSGTKFKYENKIATWILPTTLPDDLYSIRLKDSKVTIITDK